jgi:hypothetical protein
MNTETTETEPKEYMNIHDMAVQCEFWRRRGEIGIEVSALDNLVEYILKYRDDLLEVKAKPANEEAEQLANELMRNR